MMKMLGQQTTESHKKERFVGDNATQIRYVSSKSPTSISSPSQSLQESLNYIKSCDSLLHNNCY